MIPKQTKTCLQDSLDPLHSAAELKVLHTDVPRTKDEHVRTGRYDPRADLTSMF
jgi:hypothetical protein